MLLTSLRTNNLRICAASLGQCFDTRRAKEESGVTKQNVVLILQLNLTGVTAPRFPISRAC